MRIVLGLMFALIVSCGFVIGCVAGLGLISDAQSRLLAPEPDMPQPPVAALIITARPGVVTPTIRAICQVGYEPVVIAATVGEGYDRLPDGRRVYVHGAIPHGDTIFTDRADLQRAARRNGFH